VIFLFAASRPDLGYIQFPIHWATTARFLGVKRPGREVNARRYKSNVPYFFVMWCLFKHKATTLLSSGLATGGHIGVLFSTGGDFLFANRSKAAPGDIQSRVRQARGTPFEPGHEADHLSQSIAEVNNVCRRVSSQFSSSKHLA
jgi:hypothetical protein